MSKHKHEIGETVMAVVSEKGKINRIITGEIIGYYEYGYSLLVDEAIEFVLKTSSYPKGHTCRLGYGWIDSIPHRVRVKALKYLREAIKEKVLFT